MGLIENLRRLGPAKLGMLGGALVLVVGIMASLALSASRPEMGLLYAGLEPEVAGEAARKLDELGIAHEIRGDAIWVAEGARDRVRVDLAAAGLPRRGQQGYELLDQLSAFGTTSEMFDATYWRAKEGELARTIVTMQNVRSARVHIVPPRRTLLGRSDAAPTAAVAITTQDGAPLGRREAQAVRHLVGLAVRGLTPDKVSVIDSSGGVVLGPEEGALLTAGADSAQAAREDQLRTRIESLLAAHVGAAALRVGVSVELDHEGESVSERTFDPEGRVAIHTDNTEIAENSEENGSETGVSVTNSLPDEGGEGAAGQTTASNRSELREVANYEVSEIRRERNRLPGAVKRISVAVAVGGVWTTAEDGGRTWRAHDEAELAAIQKLVESAIGFSAERGDVVTVESLRFQTPEGTSAEDAAPGFAAIVASKIEPLAASLALALVGILAIWFVARPIVRSLTEPPPAAPQPPAALTMAGGAGEAGTSPAALAASGPVPTPAGLIGQTNMTDPEAGPFERALAGVVEAVEQEPEAAVRVLAQWLGQPSEVEPS